LGVHLIAAQDAMEKSPPNKKNIFSYFFQNNPFKIHKWQCITIIKKEACRLPQK